MPKKIPWDEDEAIILLDALIKVLSGACTRNDAVVTVSEALRARAISKGLAIDDTFRNQNGIRWQMSFMEYAYVGNQPEQKALNVSKLFQKVVSLYKTDRATYLKRLSKAKSGIEPSKSIQDLFFQWLAEDLPSDQVPELYETLYTVCADIEELTGQSKVLLFLMINTVQRLHLHLNIMRSFIPAKQSNGCNGLSFIWDQLRTALSKRKHLKNTLMNAHDLCL